MPSIPWPWPALQFSTLLVEIAQRPDQLLDVLRNGKAAKGASDLTDCQLLSIRSGKWALIEAEICKEWQGEYGGCQPETLDNADIDKPGVPETYAKIGWVLYGISHAAALYAAEHGPWPIRPDFDPAQCAVGVPPINPNFDRAKATAIANGTSTGNGWPPANGLATSGAPTAPSSTSGVGSP